MSVLEALYAMSMESSHVVNDENEVEIYLHGIDQSTLADKAIHTEMQTQYGLFSVKTERNACASSHRVRETISTQAGETTTTYEHTFKLHMADGKKPEHTVEIDREGFDMFRLAADSGMTKRRYLIPAGLELHPQVMFEVDVFADTDWVKVDVELPEGVVVDKSTLIQRVDEVFPGYTDIIIVSPSDKAKKNEVALRAMSVMDKNGVLKGPFTA